MNEIRPGSHVRVIDTTLLTIAAAIVTSCRAGEAPRFDIHVWLPPNADAAPMVQIQIDLHPALTILDIVEQLTGLLLDRVRMPRPLPPVTEIVLHERAALEIVTVGAQHAPAAAPVEKRGIALSLDPPSSTKLIVSSAAGVPGELSEFLERFPRVLAARHNEAIGRLDLLDPAERQHLFRTWNDASRPVAPSTLAELFADKAARTPDAVALSCAGRPSLTYAQFDRRANQVAHDCGTLALDRNAWSGFASIARQR